ncbi:hypothetical protein [Vibrio phage vB_VpaP_SJSY21]|nr:hypothetical protein [Vibrio phage vB_VpaP_SJSY21]
MSNSVLKVVPVLTKGSFDTDLIDLSHKEYEAHLVDGNLYGIHDDMGREIFILVGNKPDGEQVECMYLNFGDSEGRWEIQDGAGTCD